MARQTISLGDRSPLEALEQVFGRGGFVGGRLGSIALWTAEREVAILVEGRLVFRDLPLGLAELRAVLRASGKEGWPPPAAKVDAVPLLSRLVGPDVKVLDDEGLHRLRAGDAFWRPVDVEVNGGTDYDAGRVVLFQTLRREESRDTIEILQWRLEQTRVEQSRLFHGARAYIGNADYRRCVRDWGLDAARVIWGARKDGSWLRFLGRVGVAYVGHPQKWAIVVDGSAVLTAEPRTALELAFKTGWSEGEDTRVFELVRLILGDVMWTQQDVEQRMHGGETEVARVGLERWRAPYRDGDEAVCFVNRPDGFYEVRLDTRAVHVELERVCEGWQEMFVELGRPYGEVRSAGEGWRRAAASERASVASFARASLELLMAGAPRVLVERAHRAALDEVGHTRLCLEVAGVGPGALDVELRAYPPRPGRAALAVSTLREGCVNETLAAERAASALEGCDERERGALEVIAREEREHAELAWETLAWAIEDEDAAEAVAATEVPASIRPRVARYLASASRTRTSRAGKVSGV